MLQINLWTKCLTHRQSTNLLWLLVFKRLYDITQPNYLFPWILTLKTADDFWLNMHKLNEAVNNILFLVISWARTSEWAFCDCYCVGLFYFILVAPKSGVSTNFNAIIFLNYLQLAEKIFVNSFTIHFCPV